VNRQTKYQTLLHNRPTDICSRYISKSRKHQVQIQNRLANLPNTGRQRTAAVPLLCGARLASKGAVIHASLASPAAAAEPFRSAYLHQTNRFG